MMRIVSAGNRWGQYHGFLQGSKGSMCRAAHTKWVWSFVLVWISNNSWCQETDSINSLCTFEKLSSFVIISNPSAALYHVFFNVRFSSGTACAVLFSFFYHSVSQYETMRDVVLHFINLPLMLNFSAIKLNDMLNQIIPLQDYMVMWCSAWYQACSPLTVQ